MAVMRAILTLIFLLTSVKATFAGTNTPPVNDNFANRLPISFRSIITNAAAATMEPGEPIHTTNFTAGSLWWTWTPTNTGTYRIQTLVDSRDSSLAIYTGTDLTNLTFVIRSELGGTWRDTAMIDFHAEAATEYFIAATCLINDPLIMEIHTPPANDSFSAAVPIILNEPQTNRFVITTGEPGEPSAFNGVSLSHSGSFWYSGTLWYTWTAPHSGPFLFRTHLVNPSFGNVLSAYTGSDVTDLNSVPFLQYEAQSGVAPAIAFRAQEGMSYHFALKSIATPYERTVTATILPGHPHDDITNAAPVSGQFVVWTNTVFGATTEPGEDVFSFRPSIWSQWTAPDSGTYKLALPLGFRPGVYRGSNFTEITKVTEAFGTNITLTFTAEAGVSYKLRTAREHHLGGDFVLRLGPAVTNEFPISATELSGEVISVVGQNWTATTGPEPSRRTMWYKWTAPDHGLITFSSAPGNLIHSSHTKVPTIESNLLSSGSIQASSISGTNVAAVTAGVSYLFGVRAPFSTNIPFNLQFHPKAAALGNLSGALYGGDALWSPQTNVFFSAPDALQSGLLSSNQSAFIELVIYGSGTLQFQTKIDGGGSIVVARSQMRTLTEYRGTHDWTLRTINLSGADYSVVRFTMLATNTSGGTPTVWLDDIEFTSQPPSPPSLVLFSITDAIQLLAMPVQAGRLTTIETSTNLADWLDWTNVLSSTSHYPHFRLPALPDNTPQFFRARVTP